MTDNHNAALEWVDPPEHQGPGRLSAIFTAAVRDALRSRPGEWACVRRSSRSSTPAYYFRGNNPDFEAKASRNPDKTFDLYARFVGEQS